MLYRIRFNPHLAAWYIQVSHSWGLKWHNVMSSEAAAAREESGAPAQLRRFKTYTEAQNYVGSVGLDKVYADKTSPPSIAGGVHIVHNIGGDARYATHQGGIQQR